MQLLRKAGRWSSPVLVLCFLARPLAAQEETPAERAEKLIELIREAVESEPAGSKAPPQVLAEIDTAHVPPEAKEIVRVLKDLRVDLTLEKQDLSTVVDLLRQVSGLNFAVSPLARAAMEKDRPQVQVFLRHLPLENVLNLLAIHLKSYCFTVRHGAVLLVRNEEVRTLRITRLYVVEDLLRPRRDFPAPRLALESPHEKR